jgi:uncharacterized protein YjlB
MYTSKWPWDRVPPGELKVARPDIRILWGQEVHYFHYYGHNNHTVAHILSRTNAVHTFVPISW